MDNEDGDFYDGGGGDDLAGGDDEYDYEYDDGGDAVRGPETAGGAAARDTSAATPMAGGDVLEAIAERSRVGDEKEKKEEAARRKNAGGFTRADGTRRRYAAPAPPKKVDWTKAMWTLARWAVATELGEFPRTFNPDSTDVFSLLPGGMPEDDLVTLLDTRQSAREALEVIRPFVVAVEDDGAPAAWRVGAEDELADRGIKLADSFFVGARYSTTQMRGEERECVFGVRAFHIGFRYFVFVVLGGDYPEFRTAGQNKVRFASPDGRPVVGYYIVALSKEEAIKGRCI